MVVVTMYLYTTVLAIVILAYTVSAIAKSRTTLDYYSRLGFTVITAALFSIYTLAKFFDLSSLWPQFFLTLLTISIISSVVMVAETYQDPLSSFPYTAVCCLCPGFLLCLLTVCILTISLVWEDTEPTYKAYLVTYGFPCFVWLCKYLIACILISAFSALAGFGFEGNQLQIQQAPNNTWAQVTEFVVKEMKLVMRLLLLVACMALVYWVFSLVFGDVPGMLSISFLLQVSCVGGGALSRLLLKDKQNSINELFEVFSNSFSALTSLAFIASASQLISSL
jgi:hypothetical protein